MDELRLKLGVLTLTLGLSCAWFGADPPRQDPSTVAKAFSDALQARSGRALNALLVPDLREQWTPERLDRAIDRALARGAVYGLDVELGRIDAGAEPDEAVEASAEYSIEYRSHAIDEPFALEGSVELRFDEESGRWVVPWTKALLLPGLGSSGPRFEVRYRWPARARLLDRDGRVLARGAADRRHYPQGSVAGSTIGHLEPLENGLEVSVPGRSPGDLVGGSGLEAGLEERLAGTPATRLLIVNRKGETVRTLGRRASRRGKDLTTTLDVEVQRAAQQAYGSTTGGAVVVEPSTGDLLAVVSSGSFDPNFYVGTPGVFPFNRALSGLYPPGSSMKVMTAAAALDSGTVTPSTQLSGPDEYKGVRNFESGEFGTIDFATALENSVNTAFAQVAERVGARKLTSYAQAFGFNKAPTMPLEAATPSFPFPQDLGDLMWGSIGQAQTLATPLQMATIAATIANDGKRMEPRILRSAPKRGLRAVSRETAATLNGLMQRVVQSGTGEAAQISGVAVAGKTGTAEVDVGEERLNHAWFVAFAPASDPQVAVAVVSEYGGIGGRVAAPIARAILSAVLPLV